MKQLQALVPLGNADLKVSGLVVWEFLIPHESRNVPPGHGKTVWFANGASMAKNTVKNNISLCILALNFCWLSSSETEDMGRGAGVGM